MTDANIEKICEKSGLFSGKFWLMMAGMIAVIALGGIFFS